MHHPTICEVAVVGVADDKWGETPHAFVVLNDEMSVSSEELTSYARERMAHFKVPQQFHFVDQLPKTATGKIQKYVLRQGQAGIAKQ